MVELASFLHRPERIETLRLSALLDSPAEEAFDRLSRLAARLLGAPIALVSLVDSDRQFFKSCIGLEIEPWKSARQTPLSHSFCKHNHVAGQPLVIEDARTHPLVRDNRATTELDVVAYLGFPLATANGQVLGSFCVIDTKPRAWAEQDIEMLRDLAAAVMAEIQLRIEIATRQEVEGERDTLGELNSQLVSEIAARKRAEDEQRMLKAQLEQTHKIEAIGKLAGGVAHDLNNLLAPCMIYVSLLLEDDDLSEHHREIIERINETGLRARAVIRELLTFGRMQADEHTVTDLNEVIINMESLLRRAVPEDTTIAMKLGQSLDNVYADPSQLERVLLNLVVNSADAMPGGGRLVIETGMATLTADDLASNPEATAGDFVMLTVSDDGVGMDDDTARQLFDPFFSTKGPSGVGLGLTTVCGAALQHGGTVRCTSEVGVGTEMRFYLPGTKLAVGSNDADRRSVEHNDTNYTIFVAEDDQSVRESTVLALQTRGFHVLSAANGSDALEQLIAHDGPVDLLLTDVVMPGMSGRALYDRAVVIRPTLHVLYMSGYNDDIASHRGGLSPGSQFIAKPFVKDELLEKVSAVLLSRRTGQTV